MNNKKPNCC